MPDGISATIDQLLTGLNEPQREAVTHTDGPLLVLAGPGSGKTRVVTRRAAYLAGTVTEASRILAITFTNKAAQEMRDRIEALGVQRGMTVCTFHALGAKLLRWHHDRAGVPKNFTIFDRDDRRKVLKAAVEQCDLSAANWSPATVEEDISRAKNEMLTADEFAGGDLDWREQTIARIYSCYERLLAEMGGLDFDDLLMRLAMMLERDSELCATLQDRFRYVLIDEYQDTNAAQYKIARSLTERHRNVCATGDPDQSVYGWRGADIGNILRFERDFPNAKVVLLEQNYRSTGRILSAADALIGGNIERKEKTLWTENGKGAAVRVHEADTAKAEAEWVAGDIRHQTASGTRYSEIAVFYRVNSLSRVVEEAFISASVPHQIARGVAFYGRKEIKDVLAYLRVLINPSDEVSLLRIINTPPRGIGGTTVRRLVESARSGKTSIHDLVVGGNLEHLGRSADKVREFAGLLMELAPVLELPAAESIKRVLGRSGLSAMYSQGVGGQDSPAENLNELVSAATEFQGEHPGSTMLDWLEHTALVSDTDSVRAESGAVTLMTLHAAKGLEFDVVYVLGLEDGMLPFRRGEHAVSDEEEERRLLFVGITRARKRLTLSHARFRMRYGSSERTTRSPFLDELPRDEVEWDRLELSSLQGRTREASGGLPDDIEQWTIGTIVSHPKCGLGRVVSIHRGPQRTHVEVQHRAGPRRTWVLEFAELSRVEFDEVGDLDELAGD